MSSGGELLEVAVSLAAQDQQSVKASTSKAVVVDGWRDRIK